MRTEDFDKIVSDLKIDLLLNNNREIFGVIASRIEIKLAEDNSEDSYGYTDGKEIRFYPNMFYNLTYRNVEFIIAHELMHLILDHLTRREDKNPIIWNFACDYVVNYLLHNNISNGRHDPIGEMPEGTLYEEEYANMSAEEIYDLLIENNGNKDIKIIKYGDGSLEAKDLRKKKTDNHSGVGEVSKEAEQQFLVEVASDIDKCVGKSNAPSCLTRGLSKLKKVNFNWKPILRRYMNSLIKNGFTWRRPFKKLFAHGVYYPSVNKEQTIKIGCAIDVSGSVSQEQLQELVNMLYTSLYQIVNFEIYVWLFSGIVHKETMVKITPQKKNKLLEIKYVSNGATEIKANIDFVNSTKELNKLDLLIIMTDGYDYLDTMKYDKNLLWCIIDNSSFKNPIGCKKGKIIQIPRKKKNNY